MKQTIPHASLIQFLQRELDQDPLFAGGYFIRIKDDGKRLRVAVCSLTKQWRTVYYTYNPA